MLPEDVRNNPHLAKWMLLLPGETDIAYADEVWERKKHPNDIPPTTVNHMHVKGTYFGEWIDKTELHKAKIEAYEAAQALIAEQEKFAKKEAQRRLLEKHDNPLKLGVIGTKPIGKKAGCP